MVLVLSNDRGKEAETQCKECKGFGNIQRDFANTLQKKKKAMVDNIFSDDESEASDDESDKSNVISLTARIQVGTFSDRIPGSDEVIDIVLMEKIQLIGKQLQRTIL